ncbi:MAG: hypothetical protein HS122_19925 [Opitutaceae bacterium]|nr:hypothetical protein [Opitutaceae bacterium]
MSSLLAKLAAWLLQKLAVVTLIVVLALVAYALYFFIQDQRAAKGGNSQVVAALKGEKERLLTLKTQIESRIASIQAEAALQKDRIQRAEKILGMLRELSSWWDRLFGNAEQQRMNEEQAKKVEALKKEAAGKLPEIERLLTHTLWEKEGVALSLERVDRQIVHAENADAAGMRYLKAAWDASKWYIAVALATYLFGPTLWKLFMYYGIAPLVAAGRPLRFSSVAGFNPDVGPSHVSVDSLLWPGERLRVKEKYLQASDEGLTRKTRFLLDWSIPFTSLACGLSELVEMRNSTAGAQYLVTFSNAKDPHIELAVVQVPQGGSLILRPSYLAGAINPAGERLRISRRWVIWRWLSWVTLQFRFFEFRGPCRLIVAGTRGVRAEHLTERDGQARAARRTNQDATIGFTPNLAYRPVRAETFWGYYRDMNPLFDDLFAGPGVFICQETAQAGAAEKAGKFWASIWNGLLKVFGM